MYEGVNWRQISPKYAWGRIGLSLLLLMGEKDRGLLDSMRHTQHTEGYSTPAGELAVKKHTGLRRDVRTTAEQRRKLHNSLSMNKTLPHLWCVCACTLECAHVLQASGRSQSSTVADIYCISYFSVAVGEILIENKFILAF